MTAAVDRLEAWRADTGFVGVHELLEGAGAPRVVLLQVADNGSFRSNIGFSELAGASAEVQITR